MTDTLYLVWRYLRYHRYKTAVLVAAITLILYLPTGLNVLFDESAAELTARAASTPLLVGAKGSRLELVLSSLYFDADPPETVPYHEAQRVAGSGLATAVPLYLRFRIQRHPIVGTSLGYLDFRRLELATGRAMAVLGECVLGANAAASLDARTGDSVSSSPETLFDLAGAYPLKMTVTGILARSHSPDDEAVFVDLKTAWVIAGLGHGHQDLDRPEAAAAVLTREGDRITANASLVKFQRDHG